VGGSWIEFSKDLQVEAEVRFEIKGEWTSWIELEEEEDTLTPPSEGKRKYATAATNPAESFQYKFILHGDKSSSPIVKDIEWTFIKAAENVENAKTASFRKPENQKIGALADSAEIEKYAAYGVPSSKVVSRAEWGANESYRYVSDNSIDVELEYDADFHAKYAEELQYSKIVEADENGDKYKWPLQYPEKVEKFIIHHTATTKTLDDPKQAIRDIYYYHAIKRGWGDIGYNYIVDQEGIVYEGRYGGEGVIGGHSGPGNHGSIGIAILGNFEEAPVPEKLFLPIGQFIYKKAQIHGINPLGTSMFRGKDMENIFGHRDIMPTTCPGQYLYEKLPVIRALATKDFTKKEKFIQDYDLQNLSEIYFIELNPEETREIIIKMENIGTKDWGAETVLKFQQFDDFDGTVSFIGSENDTIAKMQEAVVTPGNTATFKFKILSSKESLNSSLNLSLLINGKTKLKDALTIPLIIAQPIYKFNVVETKYPPKIMKKGEVFEGYVKLKNTGNVTWKKSGTERIELREDQNSEFLTKKTKILATLTESKVKPGGIATFKLKLKAPSKGGYYNEVFKPVIKDAVFIPQNMAFETIVYEKDYDGALVAKTLVSEWEKGKIYTVSVKLRNVGSKPWNKKDLSVAFLKEKDLKINDLTLSPSEVKTGEVGEINFNAVVDANEKVGEKNIFLRPRLKGKTFLPLPVSIT
ncbi:MAG: N-acetylmuramoyl-L-alanine amidase, partial [Patescibacteria group bacterium]